MKNIKVEFESAPSYMHLVTKKEQARIRLEMSWLLHYLSACTNKSGSVECLKYEAQTFLEQMTHFKYGFGSNHMWVKQVVLGETLDTRILIITWED